MPDEIRAVEFVAEVRQVKTMADGTVNVTLNLPEYCKPQAAWFMQHQGEIVKEVSVLENWIKLDGSEAATPEKETEGSGYRVDSRRLRDRGDQRTGGKV